jgi:hypothetical protein
MLTHYFQRQWTMGIINLKILEKKPNDVIISVRFQQEYAIRRSISIH